MLVSQNKEMAAMLVSQTKPLGIELYFMQILSFVSASSHVNENALLMTVTLNKVANRFLDDTRKRAYCEVV